MKKNCKDTVEKPALIPGQPNTKQM